MLGRLGQKPDISGLDIKLFPCGVENEAVYEFYGMEGTGKTQCLLHMIANCVLPRRWKGETLGGHEVQIIFVDTDYHFNIVRLTTIIESRLENHLKINNLSDISDEETEQEIKSSLKRLHVVKCKSIAELIITLHSLQSFISSHCEVCVLMIDSISAFHWINRKHTGDSSKSDFHMQKICNILQSLINTYRLVVFVTKYAYFQKSEKFTEENQQQQTTKPISIQHCEYLGNCWSKLVTHRLIFEKQMDSEGNCSYTVNYDKGFKLKPKQRTKFVIKDCGMFFSELI